MVNKLVFLFFLITINSIDPPNSLKELSNYINNLNSSWKAKYNKLTEEILLIYSQYKPSSAFLNKDYEITSIEYPNISIPETFDLRKVHPECKSLNIIQDTSQCHSHWAISVSSAISDRICIYTKGEKNSIYSAIQIISCGSKQGDGCQGGEPIDAWAYWNEQGLVTGGIYKDKESCKPYPFPQCFHGAIGPPKRYPICQYKIYVPPECNSQCDIDYPVPFNEDKVYGSLPYRLTNEEHIKKEIITKGSVQASFILYEDFIIYDKGVYQHIQGWEIATLHVKLIGWGVEDNIKYWLAVNNWNETWGDEGLFKIRRGNNECGIESNVYAAEVLIK